MNEYRALSEYYDRLMGINYNALADNIAWLLERYGNDPHTILDLGCGSGNLTEILCARGYDMIGVDHSMEMLALAAEKCPGALLLCQDMRKLDLYDVVDAAVCTLDSFNHLLTTTDIANVLERLRLFVAPGGLLIFDANTQQKHRQTLGNNTFALEEDGLLCVWQNTLNEKTCTVTMQLDFFEEEADGRYIRTSDVVKERAYSYKTWEKLLNAAGFELLNSSRYIFADAQVEKPLTEDQPAQRCVYVARNTRPADDYT